MSQLEMAVAIAETAHEGQLDKTGKPYVSHCRRVADAVETPSEKIVAYLHDVLEKGGWSKERLSKAGFNDNLVTAVDALTRRANETHREFVRRAASNELARPIKHADLVDNLRQARESGRPTGHYEDGLRIMADEFGVRQ